MGKKRGKNYRVVRKNLSSKGQNKKIAGIVGIIGLVAGVLFLSSSLTGYVIGNLNKTSSSWIGAVLFVIGLVGVFVYLGGKNKMTLEQLGEEVEAEKESVRGRNILARAIYRPSKETALKGRVYKNLSETRKAYQGNKGYSELRDEATIKDPVFQYLAAGGRHYHQGALKRLVNRTMEEKEYNKLAKAAEKEENLKPIKIPTFRPYPKSDEKPARPYRKDEAGERALKKLGF